MCLTNDVVTGTVFVPNAPHTAPESWTGSTRAVVCSLYDAMLTTRCPLSFSMSCGVLKIFTVPCPNFPCSPFPKLQIPLVVRTTVWIQPQVIFETNSLSSAFTNVGTILLNLSPCHNWPCSPPPNVYTFPCLVTTAVWNPPHAICFGWTPLRSSISLGAWQLRSNPSPNLPNLPYHTFKEMRKNMR